MKKKKSAHRKARPVKVLHPRRAMRVISYYAIKKGKGKKTPGIEERNKKKAKNKKHRERCSQTEAIVYKPQKRNLGSGSP